MLSSSSGPIPVEPQVIARASDAHLTTTESAQHRCLEETQNGASLGSGGEIEQRPQRPALGQVGLETTPRRIALTPARRRRHYEGSDRQDVRTNGHLHDISEREDVSTSEQDVSKSCRTLRRPLRSARGGQGRASTSRCPGAAEGQATTKRLPRSTVRRCRKRCRPWIASTVSSIDASWTETMAALSWNLRPPSAQARGGNRFGSMRRWDAPSIGCDKDVKCRGKTGHGTTPMGDILRGSSWLMRHVPKDVHHFRGAADCCSPHRHEYSANVRLRHNTGGERVRALTQPSEKAGTLSHTLCRMP